MRFMMLIKGDENYEAGGAPSEKLEEAMLAHIQKLARAGVLHDTAGLLPSSKGARIRVGGGKVTITDGPFSEAKELVGGYAILRVKSRDEAIELGREFMQLHVDVLGTSYQGELEIREMDEFSPEILGT